MASREDSKLQKIFIYFCGLLPILVFPIALIAPQGLDLKSQHLLKLFTDEKLAFNGFQFQIPALSIAALMAMALLLIYPPINLKEFPQLTKFAVIFVALCGISALLHHSDPLKILSIWAYVIVPMSLMMCKGREKIQKFLGLYFLVNITIYFLFNSPTGISANKNWLAAGLLATLPFGVKSLQAIFFKVLICIPRNMRNSSSVILSFTFAVILTLTALYKLTSRAAWLALIIILSLKIYCGCSEKLKKFFIYFSIIMTLAIASFAKINYQKITHNELRPLLWKGTAKMIESAPFLGASGPGQFENKFAQFRLPEQFLLPIAAPNSQHPHNEILRIASEAGLPACLALICFVILIVKGKNNNHAAYHCFIVLATCSMFDKLLAENATGLIFLISLGLLIPQHINQPRKLPFQKCRSIMACVILLVGIILCWRNVQSSWFYRHGFNDQSAAMYSLNNAKKKIYWQKSYESFAKAANDDPYNTKANYFAANAALLGLKSDSKAIPFLNNLMNRSPDYINLNRLITYYQEIRARKIQNPSEKKLARELAYKANARELQINGVRLSNIGDAMLFALRNQDLTLAFKTHKLFELNSVRLAYHLYGSDTVKDKIRKWQTAVLNNKVEDALKIANEIRGVKGLKFVDPLYINQAPQNFKNTDILKSETFTHADFLYWKEIIAIRAELSQHDSFKKFCEKQLERISVSNDNAFKSPLECLSESQLNNTSFVGFFAQAATILGRPHLILKTSKDNYQILIQNGLSSLLLSSNSKEIKELNHQSISDSLRVKTQECSIFCSPQSFFSANTYLISLYNCEFRSQSISPCTPSLSWVMANQVCGGNYKVQICQESFLNLIKKFTEINE